MKRLLCALLCVMMLLSLCACGRIELPPLPVKPEPTPIPTPPPTPVPTPEPTPILIPIATPTPIPTAVPVPEATVTPEFFNREGLVIVNFKHNSYTQKDPEKGSQLILDFSYDTPVVSVQGHEAAAAAINQNLGFLDEAYYSGTDDMIGYNNLLELAEDAYTAARANGESGLEKALGATRTAEVARADGKLISIVYSFFEEDGSSHPNHGKRSFVYDMESGALLTLEDLSGDPSNLRKVLEHSLVSLTETDESLYEHVYQNYIPNNDYYGKLGQLLRTGSWYFDDNGLVVFSDLYELGPYHADIAQFRIPYGKLRGAIDERWFPEARSGQGSVRLTTLEKAESGGASFVDRIQVNVNGSELCVVATGAVYNVRLSKVSYEHHAFHETETLWYCSELRDAALQLKAELPQGIPTLMLSYTDASGQEARKLLTLNASDGTPQLSDEASVHPVG